MKSLASCVGWMLGLICLCVGGISSTHLFVHPDRPVLTVKAVAHQWWWEFDYPALAIKTTDVLHLPSAANVRLQLTSADIIHSFWIVGMDEPVDVLPGKTRSLDLTVKSPGELYGNCDSGCGCGTVCMRFRVLVSSPASFDQWSIHERLIPSEFNPPQAHVAAPACALKSGHDGRLGHESPSSHLRQLLDTDSSAGTLTSPSSANSISAEPSVPATVAVAADKNRGPAASKRLTAAFQGARS